MSLEVTKPSRTLVLCFDGTSSEYNSLNTNVVKFFSLLKKDDFNEQLCYYQAGVGTYFNPGIVSPLFEWFAKIADQAIAWYLDQHVMEGYSFIMQNYRVGDKICLFGFSRGAYTARALAGMLYKVGLLPRDNHQQIPFAYKLYTREDPVGIELSAGFKQTYCQDVKIEFIGVWDTVSSVGVIMGRTLPFVSSNSAIKTFRHALSLDERRAKFRPNTYHYPTPNETSASEDLEQANVVSCEAPHNDSPTLHPGMGLPSHTRPEEVTGGARRSSKTGVSILNRVLGRNKRGQPFSTTSKKLRSSSMISGRETDVMEVWFAGCHSDIGGGEVTNDTPNSLANITLRWMVREVMASQCGVQFEQAALTRLNIPFAFPVEPSTTLQLSLSQGSAQPLKLDANDFTVSPSDGNTCFEMDKQDAVQPLHDELDAQKLWWLLEIIPLHYSWQDAQGVWHSSFRFNLGRGREVFDERPNFHHSVKVRIDDPNLKYKPKAKWNVGQEEWVT